MRDHQEIGQGSGLLMMMYPWGPQDGRVAPVLVTNRHVVEGADRVTFSVAQQASGAVVNNWAPASGFLLHPDPHVDLCMIPVSDEMISNSGLHVAEFISSTDIWAEDRLAKLNAIENVVMIGYPDGLVDQNQLYPVSRRGITATPAFARFDGKPDFLIDCACFPGSSGSPVFLLDQGLYVDKENNTQIGETRFGLLGFLYAGPVMGQDGQLIARPPPARLARMVEVPLMMNLGVCVRAQSLLAFMETLKRL